MPEWKPGDRACCICADWGPGPGNTPIFGRTYTVREVDTDPYGNTGFWLEEFPGTEWSHGFPADAFVKIQGNVPVRTRQLEPA